MGMFNFHLSFSLTLIALTLSAALLVWAEAHKNVGTSLAKFIAYCVLILAVINVFCFGYSATRYWQEGYFKQSPMHMMLQNRMQMQEQMMKNKPMLANTTGMENKR